MEVCAERNVTDVRPLRVNKRRHIDLLGPSGGYHWTEDGGEITGNPHCHGGKPTAR